MAHLQIKRCSHDELMKGMEVVRFDPPDGSYGSGDWKNIRIEMEFSYLVTTSDYLSSEQRDIAIGTINNVKKFVEKFISVKPVNFQFPIVNFNNETNYVDKFAHNTDLHITVLAKPESYVKALSSSIITSIDSKFYKPLTGVIIINPVAIPISVQNDSTEENYFFYIILHQLFHILGISSSLFKYYHPEGSREPHSLITTEYMKNNRLFKFLITPNAQKYALNQYGLLNLIDVDDTGNLNLIGIELEDTPDQGSHFEMRTFFTEMMTGGYYFDYEVNKSFYRLTDATMAVLKDTGNYRCDYKLAQPLVWGNKESIDGKHIKNFATGPPRIVFPEIYYFQRPYGWSDNTLFDFKHYGFATANFISWSTTNCLKNIESQYCKSIQFYNPKNITDYIDDQFFDYLSQYVPSETCKPGTAMIPARGGPLFIPTNQRCGEYKCANDNRSFTFNVYNNSLNDDHIVFTCNEDNVGVEINIIYNLTNAIYNRWVWCPVPERFCRTMKLYDSHFESDPFEEN